MSENYFENRSLHTLQRISSKSKVTQIGNKQMQTYCLPFPLLLHSKVRFVKYAMESEIHNNVDLDFGIIYY